MVHRLLQLYPIIQNCPLFCYLLLLMFISRAIVGSSFAAWVNVALNPEHKPYFLPGGYFSRFAKAILIKFNLTDGKSSYGTRANNRQ